MVPTIDNYWKDHQMAVIQSFIDNPVVVMGMSLFIVMVYRDFSLGGGGELKLL